MRNRKWLHFPLRLCIYGRVGFHDWTDEHYYHTLLFRAGLAQHKGPTNKSSNQAAPRVLQIDSEL